MSIMTSVLHMIVFLIKRTGCATEGTVFLLRYRGKGTQILSFNVLTFQISKLLQEDEDSNR